MSPGTSAVSRIPTTTCLLSDGAFQYTSTISSLDFTRRGGSTSVSPSCARKLRKPCARAV